MTCTEFYFIRHGETNPHYNDPNITLNDNGVFQANKARNLISDMSFSSIHHSPLIRAIQTKEILFENSEKFSYALDELSECTAETWENMTKNVSTQCQDTENFINRVVKGINIALSKPGPVLIIAHGGIHYAFCKHHNIQNHSWAVDHCALIHFLKEGKRWMARLV